MARPKSPRPTDVETNLLQIMWGLGKGSVRDVHDELRKTKKTAYSSVATIMRIMVDKGLLVIVDQRRPQQFAPAVAKDDMGRRLLVDLREKIFGGSITSLVRHALSGKKTPAKEIAELRKLLDEMT